MRRALAILKYVPAVLCGLLVVAWVVSWFKPFAIEGVAPNGMNAVGLYDSRVMIIKQEPARPFQITAIHSDFRGFNMRYLEAWKDYYTYFFLYVVVPVPLLLSVFLPLAIAPFTHFRFPLWSYFAWTALTAAELAYYLR